VFEKFKRKKKY